MCEAYMLYRFRFAGLSLTIILFFLISAAISRAGIVMNQVRYQKGDKTMQKGNILIQNNRLRFNDLDSNVSSIIDFNNENMIIIDHNKKTYISTTLDEYIKGVEEMTSRMEKEMEDHLDSLPPEQQKPVKELMKKNKLQTEKKKKSTLSVKQTSEVSNIAGLDSSKFQILIDGQLNEEIWVSSSEKFKNELDFGEFASTMKKLKTISQMYSTHKLANTDLLNDIYGKGYPLKTADYSVNKAVYIEEVTDINSMDIKEDSFKPDPDYTEKTLDSLFGNE